VKKKSLVFQGKVFSVTRETVNEPDGVRAVREIIRHPGSSVVIARNSAGEYLLIRQYRYAARKKLWEAVAGRIEIGKEPVGKKPPGETPLQAARRELAEEAGLAARRWKKLGVFYPSPGFMDERMWLYLAEDLSPSVAECDEDERITRKWFSREEFGAMVRKNQIVDAKTVLSFFLTE